MALTPLLRGLSHRRSTRRGRTARNGSLAKPRGRRLRLEPLEDRRMLSLDPFAILSPGGVIDDSTPEITWGPSAGAYAYDLLVDDDPGFGSPVVEAAGLGGTSLTLTEELSPGTYYIGLTARENLAPGVDVGADREIDEGSFLLGTGSFTDPDATLQASNNGLSFEIAVGPAVHHTIFVTSYDTRIDDNETFPPNFPFWGGLNAADYTVTHTAWLAGMLPNWDFMTPVYTVILSTPTVDARDRLVIEGEIRNIGGELVAVDEAQLWSGSLVNGVKYDEFGQLVPDGANIWTGTLVDGTHAGNSAGSWNQTYGTAKTSERPTSTGSLWIAGNSITADESARLYALSPLLGVAPTVDVGGDAVVTDGEAFTRGGTFDDLGDVFWTATVDYGEGGGAVTLPLDFDLKTFQLDHTYATPGSYTVALTLNDSDPSTAAALATFEVQVQAAPYHRIFITSYDTAIDESKIYPPNFPAWGGLNAADYTVTFTAWLGGLLPNWDLMTPVYTAILSTEAVDARDRISLEGPLYNMAGELVAVDEAQLWSGSLTNGVKYDELAQLVPEGTNIWTGTEFDGTFSGASAGSWNQTFGSANTSDSPSATGIGWILSNSISADGFARLYTLSPPLDASHALSTGPGAPGDSLLTDEMIEPVLRQAIAYWAGQGIDPAVLASQIGVAVANLGGTQLAITTEGIDGFSLDRDAAEWGWSTAATVPADRIDLLSATVHEMGHLLELEHNDMGTYDVMATPLAPGERPASLEAWTQAGTGQWTAEVDYGDGSGWQPLVTAGDGSFGLGAHYIENGTYTVTVRVTDHELTGQDSFELTVNNVAPTLSNVSISSPIDENDLATLSGTITDPGTADTFTLDVDWGDPLSPNNIEQYTFAASPAGSQPFTITHRYLDDNPSGTPSDTYSVNATLTDDDGGWSETASGGPVALDPEFGDGGVIAPVGFGASPAYLRDVLVLPDGKILVAGDTAAYDVVVGRYNSDGTVDTTFGAGDGDGYDGFTIVSFNTTARGIARDSQGAIYVAMPGKMARFSSEGRLDTGFGTGGHILTGVTGTLISIDVASGNDVLIAGNRYAADPDSGVTSSDMAVVRFDTNGDPVASFGDGGVAVYDLGTTSAVRSDDFIRDMALHEDGRIVVVGHRSLTDLTTGSLLYGEAVVARLNPDGTLDADFGPGGGIIIDLAPGAGCLGVAIDPQQRIVVGMNSKVRLRFDENGELDPSFDGDGVVDGVHTGGYVAVDSAGRIVSGHGGAIARHNEDGSPDTEFSPTARVVVPGYLFTLAVDPQDRILVGGFTNQTADREFFMARYSAAGLMVTVSNVAPALGPIANQTANEGDTVNVSGSFSDPGADSWQATVDYGDGSPLAPLPLGQDKSFSLSHAYGDNGVYTVTVQVRDDDMPEGTWVEDTFQVTVNNVAPIVALTVEGTGLIRTFTILATDPSPLDHAGTFSYAIDWDGDSVVDETLSGPASLPVEHAFTQTGTFAVGVTATDKDGGTSLPATVAMIIEVDSTTIAEELDDVVAAVANDPEPEVILALDADEGLDAVIAAVNDDLPEPEVPTEIVVNLVPLPEGVYYSLDPVSVPAGVTLVINGLETDPVVFQSGSPALEVLSGTVLVSHAIFLASPDSPTILVTGGSLTVRNSRIEESTVGNQAAVEILGGTVNLDATLEATDEELPNVIVVRGEGEAIRNLTSSPISALGAKFELDGTPITSAYRVEDMIHHAMDDTSLGLVTYSEGNVYVTTQSGSIQRGIEVVPEGGTVNVEQGDFADYDAGSRLLTVAFEEGPTLTQQEAVIDGPSARELIVTGTDAADQVIVTPGNMAGEVVVKTNALPHGTFAPTGRLAVHGLAGDDTIQVAGSIELSAWLYGGEGNDKLKGGAGNDVIIGGTGDDLIVGKAGRDLLIGGLGADRIVGNADDDILIAGTTTHAVNPAALAAIMAEWTRRDSEATYQARIAGLQSGVGPEASVKLDNTTVFNDFDKDVLTGASGLDWFLFDLDNDRATDLKDEVFAAELAWIEAA